jgi:hypothetical protein
MDGLGKFDSRASQLLEDLIEKWYTGDNALRPPGDDISTM